MIKDRLEDINELSVNTRGKVRRGAKNFQVAPCDRAQVIDYGYTVYISDNYRYH